VREDAIKPKAHFGDMRIGTCRLRDFNLMSELMTAFLGIIEKEVKISMIKISRWQFFARELLPSGSLLRRD
jgi:hypothetical protein